MKSKTVDDLLRQLIPDSDGSTQIVKHALRDLILKKLPKEQEDANIELECHYPQRHFNEALEDCRQVIEKLFGGEI